MYHSRYRYVKHNVTPLPKRKSSHLNVAYEDLCGPCQFYYPTSVLHTSPTGSFVSSYPPEILDYRFENRGKLQSKLHAKKHSLEERLVLARQSEVSLNDPKEDLDNMSNNCQDPVASLEELAKEKSLPTPAYKTFMHISKSKLRNECFCCVTIGENYSFSTYPHGALTQLEAQQNAAKRALNYLRDFYSCIGTTEISIRNMIYNIVKIVSTYRTGTWHDNIALQYHKTHGDVLPVDWLTSVRDCPYLVLQDVSSVKTLLTINKCLPLPDNVDDMLTTYHVNSSDIEKTVLCEGFHDVFVTAVISSSEIYVRVIGEESYEKFCNISEEINDYYKNVKPLPVPEHREGCLYMIYSDESYHRVMLLNISGSEGNVNFIDHGVTEVHSLKSLFVLHPKFVQLPTQSVRCSMIGLEHVRDNAALTSQVKDILLEKCAIIFVNDWISVDNHAKALFFDTSTSEDINVNLKITEDICLEVKPLHLDINHMYNVHVAHVSCDYRWYGIYLRFDDKYFNCITDVLQCLMKLFPGMAKPITHLEIEEFSKIYLAYSEKNDAWYRAIILAQNPASQVLCVRFIDIGMAEQVHLSKLCLIKNVSTALGRLPKQAIRVELQDIVLTTSVATKLRDLLPVGQKVCIVRKDAEEVRAVPLVNMWKVCENNKMIHVNYDYIKSGDKDNSLAEDLLLPCDLSNCCTHSDLEKVSEEVSQESLRETEEIVAKNST